MKTNFPMIKRSAEEPPKLVLNLVVGYLVST